MSKAAWGALQKEGGQLMVRNFEIGVLFVPSRFAPHLRLVAGSAPSSRAASDNDDDNDDNDDDVAVVPLPHELQPLLPYNSRGGSEDRPWVWDKAYPEPDSRGMSWRTYDHHHHQKWERHHTHHTQKKVETFFNIIIIKLILYHQSIALPPPPKQKKKTARKKEGGGA